MPSHHDRSMEKALRKGLRVESSEAPTKPDGRFRKGPKAVHPQKPDRVIADRILERRFPGQTLRKRSASE
jgi:hypothetical protein